MKNKIFTALLLGILILLLRLFCGVYIHDEFGESHFFIKHRPAWKWKFYSPIGQSDLTIEKLTVEKQIEQKYFNEFVKGKGLSR